MRPHDYRAVDVATPFDWPALALWGIDFGGPTLTIEQCTVCNALRCTSDENVVRYVTRAAATAIEPDCDGVA